MISPSVKNTQAYAISIDWMQVYCYTDNPALEDISPLFGDEYSIVKQNYSTRHFQNVYEVYTQTPVIEGDTNAPLPNGHNYHYCTILTKPFSNVIDRRGCLLKLSNRELYQPDFATRLINFLPNYNLVFQSISRIDVCYDFNRLQGGLTPKKFINGFVSGKYLKNGQPTYTLLCDTREDKREHIVNDIMNRIKANKPQNDDELRAEISQSIYHMIARSESTKCKIRGSAKAVKDIHYVSFGSHASGVCSYIYNKSKEMREVKDKPYIREMWKMNGLDVNQDVWRIEISIKADSKTLFDMSTGEFFNITTDHVKMQSDIETLFYTYADRYFQFRINNLTQNKSRMPLLNIFENKGEITLRPKRITLSQDKTRADKVLIKSLVRAGYEMPYRNDEFFQALNIVTMEMALTKGLSRQMNRAHDEMHQKYTPTKPSG
jgi:hypothetical protein